MGTKRTSEIQELAEVRRAEHERDVASLMAKQQLLDKAQGSIEELQKKLDSRDAALDKLDAEHEALAEKLRRAEERSATDAAAASTMEMGVVSSARERLMSSEATVSSLRRIVEQLTSLDSTSPQRLRREVRALQDELHSLRNNVGAASPTLSPGGNTPMRMPLDADDAASLRSQLQAEAIARDKAESLLRELHKDFELERKRADEAERQLSRQAQDRRVEFGASRGPLRTARGGLQVPLNGRRPSEMRFGVAAVASWHLLHQTTRA